MLEEFKGTSEEKDRLWWKLDSKGSFKVNSAYKFLNQGNYKDNVGRGNIYGRSKSPSKLSVLLGYWQERLF